MQVELSSGKFFEIYDDAMEKVKSDNMIACYRMNCTNLQCKDCVLNKTTELDVRQLTMIDVEDDFIIDGKRFTPQISRKAFEELRDVCYDIQNQLMGMVQNEGFIITEEEMLDFENYKNNIINKINKVSMDLKIEYDKL